MSIQLVKQIKSDCDHTAREMMRRKELASLYIYEQDNNVLNKTVILVSDCDDSTQYKLLEVGDEIETKYGECGIVSGFDNYSEDGIPKTIVVTHNDDIEYSINTDRLSISGW